MLHLQQRSMLQDSNFLVRHLHRFILGLLLCLSVVLRDLVLHSRPTRLTHLSTPNQENLLYLSWNILGATHGDSRPHLLAHPCHKQSGSATETSGRFINNNKNNKINNNNIDQKLMTMMMDLNSAYHLTSSSFFRENNPTKTTKAFYIIIIQFFILL
jgi:hypothetical protein